MKIAYLHQYFKRPDENGGTRSYDLAKSFVKSGHEVEIITTTSEAIGFEKSKWKIIELDGIKVHYLYLPYDNSFSFAKRSWTFVLFLWHSFRKLLSIKSDFILATSTPLTIGIPVLLKKCLYKTPYIFEVRDVWPEAVIAIGAIRNKMMQKMLYGLEKLVYKNAVAIVPLSTDMQRSIVSRFPQFKDKTNIVIENIAEVNRFQNTTDKIGLQEIIGFEPRFSVLYAGTFGRVNGVHKVIDLAEKTLKLDHRLVFFLVGSGAEKEAVIQLAKDKEVLGKNIFILDSISKRELPLWYNTVSMGSSFVIDIPALWANSANKFFDTLAAGKPILINHEGWQADMIRSKNIGYVLPFKITDKVAQEFVDYSKSNLLCTKQGEYALGLAKEKYSLETATQNYLKVFSKVGI